MRCESNAPGLALYALASLVVASFAHVLIGLAGALGIGCDTYGEHAHAGLFPAIAGGVALTVGLALKAALERAGSARSRDPFDVLFASFQPKSNSTRPTVLAALGGFVMLVAMEFVEQRIELGTISGVGDALGGNIAVGIAIVFVVALAIVTVGLRIFGALVTATTTAIVAIVSWICATFGVGKPSLARAWSRPRSRHTIGLDFSLGRGLRAPPML